FRTTPKRFTIRAPVTRIRPTRQRLSRVPLSLSEMQKPSGRKFLPQPPDQRSRQSLLCRPMCRSVPFFRFKVVDGDKCRLAAHRQAHIGGLKIFIDAITKTGNLVPLRFGI